MRPREEFYKYNFPKQMYDDLMFVTGMFDTQGFESHLGIKHIAGSIFPNYGERHNPVELTLMKKMSFPLDPNPDFYDEIDGLELAIQYLEYKGVEVRGCDTQLRGPKCAAQITYFLRYNSTDFNIEYRPLVIAVMVLRQA